MFLATFFERLGEWWSSNDALANASGLINVGLVGTAIPIFNKFIAPKLAKLKIFEGQFQKILAVVDKINDRIESALGANLELKKDILVLKDALSIAYTNSNLDAQTKILLQEVLSNTLNGEKVEAKDNLVQIGLSAKDAVKELAEKAQAIAASNRRTAIEALNAKIAEATQQLAPKTTGTPLINSAEATKQA